MRKTKDDILSKAQRLAFSLPFFVLLLSLKCAILLRMQTWYYALFLQWMIVCHMQKKCLLYWIYDSAKNKNC